MWIASKEEKQVPDYKSFLTEFDDYVASEITSSGVSRALSYGFETGDMVWGKVKSHPWWPGHIFNEAFASPSVRRMRKMGHVLVAFFGDRSYGWFDPAELIPFEPHLAEKSQQTKSSIFVKAVEEAMDEACRRSALGLTCKCRNPNNFRATNVQGYFAVDVLDNELEGVYSSKQIEIARNSFSSVQTLLFLKRCALAPHECDTESIKFSQKKAAVSAFRRAVFEEFDETYQQAFGARSAYALVKTHEPLNNRAPSRAPLSGPLVIAETVGDLKSTKSPVKVKDSTKQDEYLPGRREEVGDITVQFGQDQASSQLRGINGSSAGDHVLQRRTPYHQTPMKHKQTGFDDSMDFNSSSGDIPGKETESCVSKLSRGDNKGLPPKTKARMRVNVPLFTNYKKFDAKTSLKQDETTDAHSKSNKGSNHPDLEEKSSSEVRIKKVNVLKQFSREMDYVSASPSEMKKKKKKKQEPSEVNCDTQERKKAFSSYGETGSKKSSSQLGSAQRHSNMLAASNSELDLPHLLSNLQALSLDPFFGTSDKNSLRAVKQFFLRFRSLDYGNILAINTSSAASENTKDPTKPTKTVNRTNEPSKAANKRLSSNHQQDIPSTKRLKETSLLKPIASDKKTNHEAKDRSNLAPLKPVREKGDSVPINTKPVKAQPEKKTAPPSEKVFEPTMLVMKFPNGTYLPSTALLKAKFGRFGPLDQSAIRVFWKASICRVVFLYKPDAQAALRYASSGNNSLFGDVNVRYSLRDVKASSASQAHEQPIHQPKIKLKSCLKKTNGNRGTARVKFMVDGKETKTEFRASGRNNGNYGSTSSSSVAVEYVSKKTQNIVPPSTTLPPQILPLSSSQYSKPKTIVNNNVVESAVDISEEMMKLLSRCNDVVANVKDLLGYVPYHPL